MSEEEHHHHHHHHHHKKKHSSEEEEEEEQEQQIKEEEQKEEKKKEEEEKEEVEEDDDEKDEKKEQEEKKQKKKEEETSDDDDDEEEETSEEEESSSSKKKTKSVGISIEVSKSTPTPQDKKDKKKTADIELESDEDSSDDDDDDSNSDDDDDDESSSEDKKPKATVKITATTTSSSSSSAAMTKNKKSKGANEEKKKSAVAKKATPPPSSTPKETAENKEDFGRRVFTLGTVIFEVIILILYCIFVDYGGDSTPKASAATAPTNIKYQMFPNVHTMVFVGFGFLMTFLQRYGVSAVGFNFYLSAIVIQWSVLVNAFWTQAYEGKDFHSVKLSVRDLLEGDYAAASVMISYGAILGRASSCQLLIISVVEVVFHGLNRMVIELALKCTDAGGSMVTHAFGAYFGLGVSFVLAYGRPEFRKAASTAASKNAASKTSDTFAMIGTLFLWIMWPSFNAALSPEGPQQNRAIANTILSLCAACTVTFVFSIVCRKTHKLSMIDVQNATLAGGVAMGSSANLAVYPGGAIGIGMTAGLVGVLGYNFVTPLLEKIGLYDTCGVNNLHGMPGLLGAILSAVIVAANKNKYGDQYDVMFSHKASKQAGYQVAGALVTLAIGVASGAVTGFMARPFNKTINVNNYFDDEANWEEKKLGEGEGEEGEEKIEVVIDDGGKNGEKVNGESKNRKRKNAKEETAAAKGNMKTKKKVSDEKGKKGKKDAKKQKTK